MNKLTESDIETLAIELLQKQGFNYINGYDIAPDDEGKKLIKELDDELGTDTELASASEGSPLSQDELSETQKAKAKWTQLEALIGSADRIKQIAKDIITHFEQRQEVIDGKGDPTVTVISLP